MPRTLETGMVRIGLVMALVTTASGSARATVMVPADLEVLATEATVIVRGVVVDVRARRSPAGSRIDSIVTLEASTYWKGDLGATVTLSVPGGRLGRYRSVVVGAPVFVPGDEVVLFLAGGAPSLPHVLGMSQGLYRVFGDPASGRQLVLPSPVLASPTTAGPIVRGDATRRLTTIDEFGAMLMDITAEPAGAEGGR